MLNHQIPLRVIRVQYGMKQNDRKHWWRKYCQEICSRLYARLRLPQEQTYLTILMRIQKNERETNLKELQKSSNVWLAGNEKYDSPGFCAKYVVYSLMDFHRGIIVYFELLQKAVFSDRNLGVRHYIRTQHPTIEREFNVWHLSKIDGWKEDIMKRILTSERSRLTRRGASRSLRPFAAEKHCSSASTIY
ncbi:hypothetical protein PR048_009290 [Dryococelus australis]|uniref:Uncharacterized protein n=1 Tax=Dryococelus australis TaxID=614101 RepID=A0ABQ9HZG8_9NEOP|nr:hypothetical protein PR048_009290 [Dryococelus australis]